ncbi:MAG: hypothetical protein BWK73_11730 [Thiothrix lacustris]|uniref:PIN-like domain-containing protein n=1 Tax=Thiothrix lacustris TaxID=525917 RepID=A0A1Y1QU90_9GAMM|nr:MAG: hypothetical protein BWK73_11730 [Thiothrix lacustris]
MENPKRTNYILVDFENTQVVDLSLVTGKPVKVILLIGEKQKHLPIVLVKQLLAHADQVSILESTCVGRNALDFILAYHVGQLVQQNPTGYFHIVSKDKGFDPLIAHLKQQKVLAARHDEFAKIPVLVDQPATSPPLDKIEFLTKRFSQHVANRPATRDSLMSHINATFAKRLSESDVIGLVKELQQRKFISFDENNKVQYCL